MRALKWVGGSVLVVLVALVLFVAFGLNALRGPIGRAVTQATGRELVIEGDLSAVWSWTHPRFRAENVRFANPDWAAAPDMFRAEAVEVSVSVLPLLAGRVVIPDAHAVQPEVFLEKTPDGRRNWLLDREQKDEKSRFYVEALTLDRGRLSYREPGRKIQVQAALSSEGQGVAFDVDGKYKDLPLKASGLGGEVLALRDADTPYPVKGRAKIGATTIEADGTVTNMATLEAFDARIRLQGESMVQLYEVFGIAFPETSPYDTAGRLVRADHTWRYADFSGKVGKSDLAGTFQVDTSGSRPFMSGELTSRVLNFSDLGPLVGTTAPTSSGVLPERPFDPTRWDSVDADVRLKAGRIERPEQLPLEDLAVRIQMRDKVLTLDPLAFGIAGGELAGRIRLDGSRDPIRAKTALSVRKLQLSQLFPTIEQSRASIGALAGTIELEGRGNSVSRMLGSSTGKVGLFVASGQISQFLMELAALDLWDVAKLALRGDEPVKIRCAIADFAVKEGTMVANALVLDTAVVNIVGGGSIDLKQERMELRLQPEPKDESLASLNSPLYVRGTFSDPEVGPDVSQVAAKGLGAVVMGIVNPLLAVIPLLEEGGGEDSDCGKLIAEAKSKRNAAAGATKGR